MLQFLKYVLATLVGIFLFFVLSIFIIAGVASGLSKKSAVEVKEKSILHLRFDLPIPERTIDNTFSDIDFDGFGTEVVGLNDIRKSLKKASSDKNIKGIFLDLEGLQAGAATIEEIRNSLIEFKKSGKFIYAYAETYYPANYYLASVADKIWLVPTGDFIFNGTQSEVMFFTGALEKMGIEMQIIRHGKFKGAVEPFFLKSLSPENRKQIESYRSSNYNHFLGRIAASRKMDIETLRNIAYDLKIRSSQDAVDNKMVDGLKYRDEVNAQLKSKLGLGEKDKLSFITLAKYKDAEEENKKNVRTDNRIAIVYAQGEINGGQGDDETIGSDRISEAIRKARMDDKVKAIVFRINSPGGSALASDVIWREVVLAREKKPVIVSMGDVAASGGYYIACPATAIVAQPNTITGSIGVFGLIPNAQKLLNEKLGINIDKVKLGKYSDLGSVDRPMTSDEQQIIQGYVDRIYVDFIEKVAKGRKMKSSDVDSIGQGRVWSAIDAKRIGLVDTLGGIDLALSIAASKAKLTDYKITELPALKDPVDELLKKLKGDARTSFLKEELGANYRYYQQLKKATQVSGILMRLPYELDYSF